MATGSMLVTACGAVSPGEVAGPSRPLPAAVATPADASAVQGAPAAITSSGGLNATAVAAITDNATDLNALELSPACRAAREIFVPRAADIDDSDAPTPSEAVKLMEEASSLADGTAAADIDLATRFIERQRRSPKRVTETEKVAHTERMDRLLLWAVRSCPLYDAVWSCSSPAPQAVGKFREKTGEDGALSARDALAIRYSEMLEEPLLLLELPRRSVYVWLDERSLVRWRVEVVRVGEYWAIDRAAVCPEAMDPEELAAAAKSVDVSGPDIVDGYISPERQARLDAEEAEKQAEAARAGPCSYDPTDTTDEWSSLTEYVISGQAEDACFALYPPERAECLRGLAPGSSPSACPANRGPAGGGGSSTTSTTPTSRPRPN